MDPNTGTTVAPIQIVLTPDSKYEKIIEVLDKDFILQPGESKKAAFKITLKSGGTYSGKLLVAFKPVDPESKEIPMMLPSTIIIIASGPINDFYYDVMGDDAEGTEIPIITDEETDTTIPDTTNSEDTATSETDASNPRTSMSFIKSVLTGMAIGLVVILAILGIIIYRRRF